MKKRRIKNMANISCVILGAKSLSRKYGAKKTVFTHSAITPPKVKRARCVLSFCHSCFTLSLKSIRFISSSTSFWYQFLHFRHTHSFTRHFFLFWLTTLLIHNSLSFTPGLKPTCFTNPTPQFHFFLLDCLHGLLAGPFLASRFLFLFFPLCFRFCAVRHIKLAISSSFLRT